MKIPVACFCLYQLFGGAAAAASVAVIVANYFLQKCFDKSIKRARETSRELAKDQERLLSELAGHLKMWRQYGWVHMFVTKLTTNSKKLASADKW